MSSLAIDPARVLDEAIEALNQPGARLPLEDVDRALEVAPNDHRLWHIKGLIHRAQEHRELALPALRRAAALAPSEAIVIKGLARTTLEAGLPSVDEHVRALRLARGDPTVLTGLASALVREGRVADAIAGLESALERQPLWIEGQILLARLRFTEGERSGFARSLERASALHPQELNLHAQLLTLLLHAEQWDDLKARIAAGRAALGGHPLFDLHEAIVAAETADTDAADRLFEPFADAQDATIQVWRVRHLLRARRPELASTLLDQWLDRSEQATFWPYAATAWRLTGDPRREWLEGDERLVGVYDIADRLPPLDQLAATLRALHTSAGHMLDQSVRGGTQTDGNLFHHIDPVLVQLRVAVRETVAEHAAQLPAPDVRHPLLRHPRAPIHFSGAWSVRLSGGGFHANHVHSEGWLSSALYVVLPPDLGREGAGWLKLGEPHAQLGLDLPPLRTVEPRPGRLVLFPSTMWHGTQPFAAGERMTVAFDVARPGQ